MQKELISAAIGFFTIPASVALLGVAIFLIKRLANFMSSPHFVGGFWSFIGICVLAGIVFGLFIFVTEFRNL